MSEKHCAVCCIVQQCKKVKILKAISLLTSSNETNKHQQQENKGEKGKEKIRRQHQYIANI